MAIVQNTLIGRARKSIGNATFCQWNGLNILKSKLIHKREQPLSEAVVLNRAKFATAGKAVGKITYFCKIIYALGVMHSTGFAEMVKFFRKKLIGVFDDLQLDIDQLVNSKFGSENTGGIYCHAEAASGATVNMTIDTGTSNPLLLVTDCKISIVVCNEDLTEVQFYDSFATGDAAHFTLPLAPNFTTGDKIFIWTGAYLPQTGTDLIGAFNAIESTSFINVLA